MGEVKSCYKSDSSLTAGQACGCCWTWKTVWEIERERFGERFCGDTPWRRYTSVIDISRVFRTCSACTASKHHRKFKTLVCNGQLAIRTQHTQQPQTQAYAVSYTTAVLDKRCEASGNDLCRSLPRIGEDTQYVHIAVICQAEAYIQKPACHVNLLLPTSRPTHSL